LHRCALGAATMLWRELTAQTVGKERPSVDRSRRALRNGLSAAINTESPQE
jgi:hypothetical protein